MSVHIIAEAGNNHNGDLDTAYRLVRAAKEAGADSVKFQIINPETLYVGKTWQDGKLADNPVIMQRRQSQLSDEQYGKIAAYCREVGVGFAASVFDEHGVDLVCALDVPYIKIASGDSNHLPLLRYAAGKGRDIVLSTGMSEVPEIVRSVEELARAGARGLVLMHCVSVYPSSLDIANLQFIDQLGALFNYPLGFSDHSPNSLAAVLALAKGCRWFEKHLTLDKSQEGFDHAYALEPEEFAGFTRDIADTGAALAYHREKLTEQEKGVSLRARRSLYAARDLRTGEVIKAEDVLVLRPAGQSAAADIDMFVGRVLRRGLKQYENLTLEHIS
ncbi:N-acetylneuraminate synthase family protein [Chloroflexota bacterium]